MKQSIILAAGLGSRLKEITKVTPKSLIEINEQPILERNIEFMIDAGIEKIIIVLGYMKDKFLYLKEKYPQIKIEFVFNDKYKEYNTIYSMYLVKEYFNHDSFVTTADIYLKSNLFLKYHEEDYSFYLLRDKKQFEKEEWTANLSDDHRIIDVNKHSYSGHAYTGISFWKKDDLKILKRKLEEVKWSSNDIKQAYWDELMIDELSNINLKSKILEDNSEIYEVDDMQDLETLKQDMKVKIKFFNIVKKYDKTLFNGATFDIKTGEIFVLVGQSGSGKSTLLKMINKMEIPDEGTVFLDDVDVQNIDTLKLRHTTGYMMQKVGLFPHMSCMENILLPFELAKKEPDYNYISYLTTKMDLTDKDLKKYPSELSGGEKQRVGLIRALATNPDLVLMDEPFSALDPVIRRVLQSLIIDLHDELKKTFVFVTHDMDEALKVADRICYIKNGEIQQIGTPYELVNHPKNDSVEEFFYRGK